MRLAVAVAVVVGVAGPVAAQDSDKTLPPWNGTLVGENDGDILSYSCAIQNDGKMRCSFVQVLLRHEVDRTDEFLSMLPDNPVDDPDIATALSKCEDFIPAIQYFIDHSEINPNLIADISDVAGLQMAVNDDPDFAKRAATSILEICAAPTKENIEKISRIFSEKTANTCDPFVNQYEQTFIKISNTMWVVESTPSGECGIINTSRFSTDGDSGVLWDYTASKVVTNKVGQMAGGMQCVDFDESPQPYLWKATPKRVDCVYLK